jgi:acyl-coenzyme A thioesterase PaaI-like protein
MKQLFSFDSYSTYLKDTLHGGMISALTDSVSTLALETNEKKPSKSASIELSVS